MRMTTRNGEIWESEVFDPIPGGSYIGDNVMPDGRGGWQPIPPVLTRQEAILYLRLDSSPNPERSLQYYRENGLKAVQLGKELRFTRGALDAFLEGKLT